MNIFSTGAFALSGRDAMTSLPLTFAQRSFNIHTQSAVCACEQTLKCILMAVGGLRKREECGDIARK